MSDRAYIKEELLAVREAILKDGSDPVKQILGYILSQDPTYIPKADGARERTKQLDRDVILKELIRSYFENNNE